MPTAAKSMSMNDTQFAKLRKVIYERSGIHFPDGKKYVLESRLSHRLAELNMEDFDQYTSFLTIGPYQAREFQEMFNRITINDTGFFRNEPQLDYFEKQVLPELIAARTGVKRLRVWSAACSTGEEPFTLAMLLHRSLGVRLADWHIEILGTDISEHALEAAAAGRYTEYAMRSTPQLARNHYFKTDGSYMVIDPTIRSMVSFELHNLKDRLAAKRHGVWDIIFCRNVMIYFDDAMRRQVLSTFGECLADDGRLFIGHSETVRPEESPFTNVNAAQACCYRKAAK